MGSHTSPPPHPGSGGHTSPPPHPDHPTSAGRAAENGECPAAAPPHPGAAGTGETSFGDAEAPAASELAAVRADLEDLTAERDKYLALAQRAQADFENSRKRMAREKAE